MSKFTNHLYEGGDAQFHGPQQVEMPGPAYDDVFGHIHVENQVHGYLIIRRLEDGVLLLPQKRTCGHVRMLKPDDGPVPDILEVQERGKPSDPKISKTAITSASPPNPTTPKKSSVVVTPQKSVVVTPQTDSDSEITTYASYVASLELNGKGRLSLHNVKPRITRWGVVVESPGLRAFEGYDDRPLRQGLSSKKKSVTEKEQEENTPGGQVVKIASPGTIWTLPISGGAARYCCLHGFQVRSGPFFSLMVQASYVERMVGRDMPEEIPFMQFVKIKVDDLFANGMPEPKLNKTVRFTGENIAAHFVEKARKWKDWANVKTIQSAVYIATMKKMARNQAKHLLQKKKAEAEKQAKEKKKQAEQRRRQDLAVKAQQAMRERKLLRGSRKGVRQWRPRKKRPK